VRELQVTLEERWTEYVRLYEQRETYSAFVRLGEIANCLNHATLRDQLIRKWSARISNVPVTAKDLHALRSAASEQVGRVSAILRVGTTFTYEELLLAITTRIELELLSNFLRVRGIPVPLETSSLDEQLAATARDEVNASAFRSAQAAARENWGIPVHSRWLAH
jgi:hypothetical protein